MTVDKSGTLSIEPGDALIVVDVQNDFLPGGVLAVTQGNEVVAQPPCSRVHSQEPAGVRNV